VAFSLSSELCLRAADMENFPLVEEIINWTLIYMTERVDGWIAQDGGWVCWQT